MRARLFKGRTQGDKARLGNPPTRHRGPSGPEPQKSPKRVRKGVPGPPASGRPQSPQRVRPVESEKSPKRQLRTLFGLFADSVAHSLGTLGLPGAGPPFGLLGFRARRARETSVLGRGVPKRQGTRQLSEGVLLVVTHYQSIAGVACRPAGLLLPSSTLPPAQRAID